MKEAQFRNEMEEKRRQHDQEMEEARKKFAEDLQKLRVAFLKVLIRHLEVLVFKSMSAFSVSQRWRLGFQMESR